MQSDGERSEDRAAIGLGAAVERDVDVLETGLNGNSVSRQERKLRGASGKPFERGQPVGYRELPDCIHSCIKVHWREARPCVTDFGNSRGDLKPDV